MKIGPQDTWRPGIARFFLAGYASGEAVVKLWPRAGANLGTCLGVVLSGGRHGWHHRCSWRSVYDLPCLIWTSREAV